MRKIFATLGIFAVAAIGLTVLSADTTPSGVNYRGNVGTRDTLTNSETDTIRFTVTGSKADFTIQTNITAGTGTIAGYVQYWYTLSDAVGAIYYLAEVDTFSNATRAYAFERSYNPGYKWMVIPRTTGTSVCYTETHLQYRAD